jgi:hypothetical protein
MPASGSEPHASSSKSGTPSSSQSPGALQGTGSAGDATSIGTFANGERDFTPPDPGEMLDWVLVLDDAGKGYRAPGRVR